jgi:hypothetical protein
MTMVENMPILTSSSHEVGLLDAMWYGTPSIPVHQEFESLQMENCLKLCGEEKRSKPISEAISL